MRKIILQFFISAGLIFLLIGCGGSEGDECCTNTEEVVVDKSNRKIGKLIDAPIQGVRYICADFNGITDENGTFEYEPFKRVEFFIGNMKLGSVEFVNPDGFVFPQDLVGSERDVLNDKSIGLAIFLQSMDDDGDISKNIIITPDIRDEFYGINIDINKLTLSAMKTFTASYGENIVSEDNAIKHLQTSSQKYINIAPKKEVKYTPPPPPKEADEETEPLPPTGTGTSTTPPPTSQLIPKLLSKLPDEIKTATLDINISSNVAGASVLVDGVDSGVKIDSNKKATITLNITGNNGDKTFIITLQKGSIPSGIIIIKLLKNTPISKLIPDLISNIPMEIDSSKLDVIISSNVAGASVFIDGKDIGVKIKNNGTANITLNLEGADGLKEFLITLKDDKGTQSDELKIVITKNTKTIIIDKNPPDAPNVTYDENAINQDTSSIEAIVKGEENASIWTKTSLNSPLVDKGVKIDSTGEAKITLQINQTSQSEIFYIYLKDEAGNLSKVTELTIEKAPIETTETKPKVVVNTNEQTFGRWVFVDDSKIKNIDKYTDVTGYEVIDENQLKFDKRYLIRAGIPNVKITGFEIATSPKKNRGLEGQLSFNTVIEDELGNEHSYIAKDYKEWDKDLNSKEIVPPETIKQNYPDKNYQSQTIIYVESKDGKLIIPPNMIEVRSGTTVVNVIEELADGTQTDKKSTFTVSIIGEEVDLGIVTMPEEKDDYNFKASMEHGNDYIYFGYDENSTDNLISYGDISFSSWRDGNKNM